MIAQTPPGVEPRTSLADAVREVAPPFLRLGTTAFGGPAAHIAMMEEEFVRRRGWLEHQEFLDMLGAASLIPGPSSTEVAIHIGHRRAGWLGLAIGGTCFILPAMLIVLMCAWGYVHYGSLPQTQGMMYGAKPVIIAVILQALWNLARTAIKGAFLAIIAIAAVAGTLAGGNILAILLGAGILAMLREQLKERGAAGAFAVSPKVIAASVAAAAVVPVTLPHLFLLFLKFGSVVFGSGYVLLAFLQADLVGRLHWLTQSQLLDAILIGQITPGPVFTTATFIGYLVGGVSGAIVATVGIFLPGFLFVAASRPLMPRLRRSRTAAVFLDGVNAGAVALMLAVTIQLSRAAIVDVPTGAIAALSALILIRFKVNSAWLIFGGAAIGLAASRWIGV